MRIINKSIYLTANILRRFGFNFKEFSNPLVVAMKKQITTLGGKIEFKIEQYPDGSWTAESVNIDGIITGGKKTTGQSALIKDAVFTWFGIPPQFCNDILLKSDNEPVTVVQHVYA